MKPLISYLHGRRTYRLGRLFVSGHRYPDAASTRRHFVVGWRYSTNRPLRFRVDDALHRALHFISPRSAVDAQIRVEHRRYREALEQISEVCDTRVRCHLHGGTAGADDDCCSCYLALDADEKAKAIAAEALEPKPEPDRETRC